MNHAIQAAAALIACAMIPSVAFGQDVASGLGTPISTVDEILYHGTTAAPNERVGVKAGSSKSIFFDLHRNTGDQAGGFVVNLPAVTEVRYAVVSAFSYDKNGNLISSYVCASTTQTGARACNFQPGTRMARLVFQAPAAADNGHSYRTYSASYIQGCGASAQRRCGVERFYGEHVSKFVPSVTENQVGSVFQGDVDVFNGAKPENLPREGDVISLKVSSSVTVANNTPTLRVKADLAGEEVQIGHRYPCTPTAGGIAGRDWDCSIPAGDAVPSLGNFANPRIVFSSSRNASGAVITIKNARKLSR